MLLRYISSCTHIEAIPALEILLKNVDKKDQFLHVHYEMCILLRVLSSDRVIDVGRLERSLNDLYQFIAQEFPWASVSPSLHSLLGHGAEFVRKNDNMGLCTLSEQGSEGKYAVFSFLVADTQLYKRFYPSIHWSVHPSVGPSVGNDLVKK